MRQPGYYPNFSTFEQRNFWDEATRALIEKRVADVPPIQFFTADELPVISAACERILPQDDRVPEKRIAIVNRIDYRLHSGEIHGYRFEDMPEDGLAYRLGIKAIDQTAQSLHGATFHQLATREQDEVLKSIHDGNKEGAPDIWSRMSIKRFWQLLVQDCATAYYSHPLAWDEIGFGGPAYPRAYMRLEGGQPEPWEVDERRYEWIAPVDSLSDDLSTENAEQEMSHPGQGGTH